MQEDQHPLNPPHISNKMPQVTNSNTGTSRKMSKINTKWKTFKLIKFWIKQADNPLNTHTREFPWYFEWTGNSNCPYSDKAGSTRKAEGAVMAGVWSD